MESIRQGFGTQRTFSATAPTARADGTPLDPSEISHYNWYVEAQGGATAVPIAVQLVNGKFTEDLDVDFVTPATYQIWYTTVDTDGRESIESDLLVIEILSPLAAPKPPSNIF